MEVELNKTNGLPREKYFPEKRGGVKSATPAAYLFFRRWNMPKRRPAPLEQTAQKDAMERRLALKQQLRDYDSVRAAMPQIDAQFIRDTRKKLSCSRALFARRLWMNERTLEKWEQGRAKPNGQAAVLLLLVRNFPDTLERLRRIANYDPC
jgi:putative transcriptional regulator